MLLISFTKSNLVRDDVDDEYDEVWKIIKSEVSRLTSIAYARDLQGKKDSLLYYKGANYLIYLAVLGVNIRHYKILMNELGTCEDTARSRYRLDCVEKAMTCLNTKLYVPYGKIWNQIKEALEINPVCGDFDGGIGAMELTKTFIVS